MVGDRRCSGVNAASGLRPHLSRGSPRARKAGGERGDEVIFYEHNLGRSDTEGKKGAKKIYKTINKRKETERVSKRRRGEESAKRSGGAPL